MKKLILFLMPLASIALLLSAVCTNKTIREAKMFRRYRFFTFFHDIAIA